VRVAGPVLMPSTVAISATEDKNVQP